MKVFITGGTGFVGSHLANHLSENGFEVSVGDINPENSTLELKDDIKREEIDVTDSDTLDFKSYDAVIHLVALSPLKKPSIPYERIHVEGTDNVIRVCEEDNISKYVHLSALDADREADTEYLRTKGQAQEIVENSELDYTVFRPSVMYGEGGEFLSFLEKFLTPYISFLPGGGRTLLQPLYIGDAVEIFRAALEDENHRNKVYSLGGPEALSMAEISKKIEKSKGRKLYLGTIPFPLVKIGLKISDIAGFSLGMDQYRSLKMNNTVNENCVKDFKISEDEMVRIEDYLEK